MTSVAWVMVTVPVQLSVATTAPSFGSGTSLTQETVVLAGMLVITGAVWSSTVIVWVMSLFLTHTAVAVFLRGLLVGWVRWVAVMASVAWVMVTVPVQL